LGFESDHLAHPQAGAVDCLEQGLVFEVWGGVDNLSNLGYAHDSRQLPDARPGRNAEPSFGPAKKTAIETDQPAESDVATAPGKLSIFDKITQILLDLLIPETVGRVPVVICQSANGSKIRLLGLRGLAQYGQMICEADAKFAAHDTPPGWINRKNSSISIQSEIWQGSFKKTKPHDRWPQGFIEYEVDPRSGLVQRQK